MAIRHSRQLRLGEEIERSCPACGWEGPWEDAPFVSEDRSPCPECRTDTNSIPLDEVEARTDAAVFREGLLAD